MIELQTGLFVGSAEDVTEAWLSDPQTATVHACRDPFHRQLLGYTGRGCPPDHPEYYYAIRDRRVYLNLIDPPDAKYVSFTVFTAGVVHVEQFLLQGYRTLVHCNQGGSRAPAIAMVVLARLGVYPADLPSAISRLEQDYPPMNFGTGVAEFLNQQWATYVKQEA